MSTATPAALPPHDDAVPGVLPEPVLTRIVLALFWDPPPWGLTTELGILVDTEGREVRGDCADVLVWPGDRP